MTAKSKLFLMEKVGGEKIKLTECGIIPLIEYGVDGESLKFTEDLEPRSQFPKKIFR